MASKRKQINVRITEEGEARLASLVERMREKLGVDVSQSDVIHAGLKALERDYPPAPAGAAEPKKKGGAR